MENLDNNFKDSLLVIIDVQRGFDSPQLRSIIPNLNMLIDRFSGEICYSKFINEKLSRFETDLNWTVFQNKDEQQLISDLNVRSGSFELTHNNYTVYNDELKNLVRQKNYKKIFLAGVFTDLCILKTAMDIFDDDRYVCVFRNAVETLHPSECHVYAIKSLSEAIGEHHLLNC